MGTRLSAWLMWMVDQNIYAWGTYVDGEVRKKKKPQQQQRRLRQLLAVKAARQLSGDDLLKAYPQMVVRD
jgi:hypothetical protein